MVQTIDRENYMSSDSNMDYYYFMKLVPHVFVDEIRNNDYSSYSYSLNHNEKVRF